MKFYQELTNWSRKGVPNHVYLLDDSKSKMFGYVPQGTKKVFTFTKPISFDVRGRKFKEVPNIFKYKIVNEQPTNEHYKVNGSKGNVYTVEKGESGYICTCQGFKFRGTCRHITEIEKTAK